MAARKSTNKPSKEPIPFLPFTPYNAVARDLTGQIFGRYTALGITRVNSVRQWVCKCGCGNYRIVGLQALVSGATRSCGCLAAETAAERCKKTVKHGMSKTGIYFRYHVMLARCTRPADSNYVNYGARGIAVCERWSGDSGFANFYADMGDPPFEGASLERKDNNGPYSPENCIWADRSTQGRNKRSNRYVTYNGARMLLKDAAAQIGIPYKILHNRIVTRGWDEAKALSQPLRIWPGGDDEATDARQEFGA